MNLHGLTFKKFDLHIHTPASSDDYIDKFITADQFVDAAIAKELAGIAVTDHHTAAWIDAVKDAAQSKGLVVFPGVEILAVGGKTGIHVLVLFDVDKNALGQHT